MKCDTSVTHLYNQKIFHRFMMTPNDCMRNLLFTFIICI